MRYSQYLGEFGECVRISGIKTLSTQLGRKGCRALIKTWWPEFADLKFSQHDRLVSNTSRFWKRLAASINQRGMTVPMILFFWGWSTLSPKWQWMLHWNTVDTDDPDNLSKTHPLQPRLPSGKNVRFVRDNDEFLLENFVTWGVNFLEELSNKTHREDRLWPSTGALRRSLKL